MRTMIDNAKISQIEKEIKATDAKIKNINAVPDSTTSDAGKVLTVNEYGNSEWKAASGGSGSLMGFRKITGTLTKKISTDIINSSSGLTNMVQLELKEGTYTAGQTIQLNQQFRLNYVKSGNRVLTSRLNSDYVFNPNGVIIKNAYLDSNHSKTFKVSLKPTYDEYANGIELADSFEVQANSDVTIASTNRIMYVEMSYFG